MKDPATAALLSPDNIFGCKRLCVDTGYFETYNLPHVKLVDVSKRPVERFTRQGIVANGTEYPVDAVVCATGFDAMTGSFSRIRITGKSGLTLSEKWQAGPRTYLGLGAEGFPNMFVIAGPGSPSVLASLIQAIEQHVDWIADCIGHLRDVERVARRVGRGDGHQPLRDGDEAVERTLDAARQLGTDCRGHQRACSLRSQ